MKIAIRGGHSLDVRGASGIVDEVTENRKITEKVIVYLKLLGHDVLDVTPSNSRSSSNDLSIPVSNANKWGADYFASIHLNATPGGYGTEVLYKSSKGKEYAEALAKEIAALGFRNRGAKQDVRGLYEFNKIKAPNNIIECFFCDSQSDVDLYNKVGVDAIAKAIVKGITGQTVQEASKKYYVVTDYIPAGEYGIELNSLWNKYFYGLGIERWYLRTNAKGAWIETQYMDRDKAQILADRLKVDNLLWELKEE
jgi:N-acetylmuramoyl-L-alanine amidase